MKQKTITDEAVFRCTRCDKPFTTPVTKARWTADARKSGWRFIQEKPICPDCLTDNERFSGYKPDSFSKAEFARLLTKQPELYPDKKPDCPGERYGQWLYEFHKEFFNDSYYHYCKQREKF